MATKKRAKAKATKAKATKRKYSEADKTAAAWACIMLNLHVNEPAFASKPDGAEHEAARARLMAELRARFR